MREGFGIRGFVGSHLVGFLLAQRCGRWSYARSHSGGESARRVREGEAL